ncbi:MAG TPA: alpha/beta hydrolase, partial [Aggregatilineales bacterium]|nr:alpha/beta hydrolase [Aggregatilineales bacterium]
AITNQRDLKGLVVSAPMIPTLTEFSRPQVVMARTLSRVAPRLGVQMRVPSSGLSKDRAVATAYDSDPNVYHGKIKARVGVEIVEGGDFVRENLSAIQLPILILHGSNDPIARPEYSQLVYDKVSSADKTIKIYDGLYHEIMNEPEKTRVLADIWVWLAAH